MLILVMGGGRREHDLKTGSGGSGGCGGDGGAAAIGGGGGRGGDGGKYGEGEWLSKTFSGNDGSEGKAGSMGEGMGTLYIMGGVKVYAQKGNASIFEREGRQASGGKQGGNEDYPSGLDLKFRHKVGGGGGGGAGGNGAQAKYDIGGGGPGGGGGGGGGSGASTRCTCWVKENHAVYVKGAGGHGGQNGNGQGHGGDAPGEYTEAECHGWAYAGQSGWGGKCASGEPDNGQIFLGQGAALPTNLNGTPCNSNAGTTPLTADQNPLRCTIHFDYTGVETTTTIQDCKYYYGQQLPDIKQSLPKAKENYIGFRGFYHNGKMVYDQNGNIVAGNEELLNSVDNIVLQAKWVGLSRIVIKTKLQDAEYPDKYMDGATNIRIEEFEEGVTEKELYIDSAPLIEHFRVSEIDCPSRIKVNEEYNVICYYDRRTYNVTFKYGNSEYKNHITILDGNKEVDELKMTLRYGQRITAPAFRFKSEDDAKGMQVTWQHVGSQMPDNNLTDALTLRRLRFAVYPKENECGRIEGSSTMQQPDSLVYGNAKTWTMVPKLGYVADSLKAYSYDAKTQTVGAEVPLTCADHDNHPDLWNMEKMPSSDVLLVQKYMKKDYHLTVEYVDSVGNPVSGMESVFVTSDAYNKGTKGVAPESFNYSCTDYVLTYAQKKNDPDDIYVAVPTVKDAVADTLITTNVEYVPEDIEAMAQGKSESFRVGYGFAAPTADAKVTYTVYYRPKAKCYVFNETEADVIDSVMVNGTRMAAEIAKAVTDTTAVRVLDIVSISYKENASITNAATASAAKAGYWDETGRYQPVSLNIIKNKVDGSDEYRMYAYTICPEATEMHIGLVEGLRIKPTAIDPLTTWTAPSGALKGDSVSYDIKMEARCRLDSVVLKNINDSVVYKSTNAQGSFVMPGQSLFVYTYAHRDTTLYDVVFCNVNGDTLQVSKVHYGDTVAYEGSTPEYETGVQWCRTEFLGWSPELTEEPVAADRTYTARYDAYFRIHDNVDNDTVVSQVDGMTVNVDLKRTDNQGYGMKAGKWYTLCLPFSLPLDKVRELWGDETVVGEFSSVYTEPALVDPISGKVGDKRIRLNFYALYGDTLQAGIPYLIYPTKDFQSATIKDVVMTARIDTITLEDINEELPSTDSGQAQGTISFVGSYNKVFIEQYDPVTLFAIGSNLYYSNKSNALPALRGHFKLKGFQRFGYFLYMGEDGKNDIRIDGDENGVLIYGADPDSDEQPTPTVIVKTDADGNRTFTYKYVKNNTIYINYNGTTYDVFGRKVSNK